MIFCGSLLGLTLVARNTQACTYAGPTGAKTPREVAEWYSEGPNASKIIFEGRVERQEVIAGPIGAPREATSTSSSDQHRVVYVQVPHSYRGEVSGTASVLTGNSDDNENLLTSICTGTSRFEEADLALRVLRGEQPSPDDLLDGETYYKKFAPR